MQLKTKSKPPKAEKPKPTPAHTDTLDAPRPAAESKAEAAGKLFRARIGKILDRAKARAAERDVLDRRTNGQYSALRELKRAFAAVLEIQAGERTLHADTDNAGDQQADSMELELLRRPKHVNNARQALLGTGFPVPDEWLTVDVDFAVGQRCSRPSTLLSGERFCDVTLPGRPGEWRVWWNAPPDRAALDRCIREIRAEIMRLGTAPTVAQAGNGKGTAAVTGRIVTPVAVRDYNVSRHTIARYVNTGKLKDHRPPGAPENSPFLLERADVAARWPRR